MSNRWTSTLGRRILQPETSLAFADQGLVSGVNFATTILLVRLLGLERFGHFSLLWMGVLFALAMQQALLGQPMLTIAPKKTLEERPRYFASVWWLQCGFTLLVFGVGFAALTAMGAMIPEEVRASALPAAFVIALRQAQAFFRSAFYAEGRSSAALWNDALAYGGQITLLVLLAWNRGGGLQLSTALWCMTASFAAATIHGSFAFATLRSSSEELLSCALRHGRVSRWLAATASLQWCASNSFLIATFALLGSGALGALKAAQGIMGFVHVFFLAMENLLPPRAARALTRDGVPGLMHLLGRVGFAGLAAIFALSTILTSWPEPVLHLFYDVVEPELVIALRGMAILYLFAFIFAILHITFRTLEDTKPIFFAYGVSVALSVLVAAPLVESLGFAGTLVGMIGQQVVMVGLLGSAFWRAHRRSLGKTETEPVQSEAPAVSETA